MVVAKSEYGHGDSMINNYAIIENGKVVNVALSERPLADNWVKSNKAAIGDDYTAGKFVRPKEDVKPEKKDKFDKLLLKLADKGLLSDIDISAIKEG